MLFALGAVSSALDALQALTSQKSSSTRQTGFTQGSGTPFPVDGSGSTSSSESSPVNSGNRAQISPETMSALIAAQSQSSAASSTSSTSTPSSTSMSPQDSMQDLFSQIDADGDGQITKSEFENALGAGGTNVAQADDVFSKLDSNGDGSVSLDEMSKALQGKGHHHGHHAQAASGSGDSGSGGGTGDTDPLMQALDGSSSTTATNSDGSTTTTITYADGSTVSMTTPASGSSSSGTSNAATSSYNRIEQMIQREAQALSSSAASSLSVSV